MLPLHSHLVEILADWVEGKNPYEKLFPKLDRRNMWVIIKMDLESAGIPYQTEEGIADFHAAGRHTHITELLRNGATVPQAKELARHSDVRTTMKYTHIGIVDHPRRLHAANGGGQDYWESPERRESSRTLAQRLA